MPLPLFPSKPAPYLEPASQIQFIIAIASGKGGVGKSTVTANLGFALHSLGYSVGILDADLYGPSMGRMVPEEEPARQKGAKILPAIASGLKLISGAYFRGEGDAAILRAPLANRLVGQFIENVLWGKLDFLLIDFPPGTGDIQLTLSQKGNLTGAVVVTTPQEIALIDVRKAIDLFQRLHIPLLGVVENMSYYLPSAGDPVYLFGSGGGLRLSREFSIPLLGQIPLAPEICSCADSGKSIFRLDPEHLKPSTQAYLKIACQLVEKLQSAHTPLLLPVVKVSHTDPRFLSIEWKDGAFSKIRFSTLQKICPCARCVDEMKGTRLSNPSHISEELTAEGIEMVGRYGIKISFTSGCSTGIYSFECLRSFTH